MLLFQRKSEQIEVRSVHRNDDDVNSAVGMDDHETEDALMPVLKAGLPENVLVLQLQVLEREKLLAKMTSLMKHYRHQYEQLAAGYSHSNQQPSESIMVCDSLIDELLNVM